jgi:hypothetical protein
LKEFIKHLPQYSIQTGRFTKENTADQEIIFGFEDGKTAATNISIEFPKARLNSLSFGVRREVDEYYEQI